MTLQQLRDRGVINDWDFFKKGKTKANRLFVWYRAEDTGYGGRSAAWIANGLGFETDAKAPWYENGCKVFYVHKTVGESFAEAKRRAFIEASQWLDSAYGIKSLSRAPTGGWGDAEFVAARIKELSS